MVFITAAWVISVTQNEKAQIKQEQQNDKTEKELKAQELRAKEQKEKELWAKGQKQLNIELHEQKKKDQREKGQKEQTLRDQEKKKIEITKQKERELYSITEDKITRLEIKFAENTGFWNDNEEKLVEIKGKAYKMIRKIPRNTSLYARIQKLIDKCEEQL